jgi:hypothetical protein
MRHVLELPWPPVRLVQMGSVSKAPLVLLMVKEYGSP